MKGPDHILAAWLDGALHRHALASWCASNSARVRDLFLCGAVPQRLAGVGGAGLLLVSDVVMNFSMYRPMGYSVFSVSMIGLYALYLLLIAMGLAVGGKQSPAVLIGAEYWCVRVFLWKQHTGLAADPIYAKTVAGWVRLQMGRRAFRRVYVFPQLSVSALFTI